VIHASTLPYVEPRRCLLSCIVVTKSLIPLSTTYARVCVYVSSTRRGHTLARIVGADTRVWHWCLRTNRRRLCLCYYPAFSLCHSALNPPTRCKHQWVRSVTLHVCLVCLVFRKAIFSLGRELFPSEGKLSLWSLSRSETTEQSRRASTALDCSAALAMKFLFICIIRGFFPPSNSR
jgi:hypothetical protein